MVNNPIHLERLRTATQGFHGALPFEHCVIDGFLDTALADQLDTEFLPFDSPKYFIYKNPLEEKKP